MVRRKMDPEYIKWLEGERDRLRQDVSSAQAALDMADRALARARGEAAEADSPPPVGIETHERMRRGFVKEHVIRLVTENGERGLISSELVDLAKAQGINLDRGSVSSLLSKLKQDGVLEYRDGKYRPAQPIPPKHPGGSGAAMAPPGGAVHAPETAI